MKKRPKSTKKLMALPIVKQYLPKNWRQKLKITLKEARFIAEYLTNGHNGTKAVISAGYAFKNDNVAHVHACQLLRKPTIAEAIRYWIDSWINEKHNKLDKQIIGVLYRQAFYDPSMFICTDGSPAFSDWKTIPEEWRCVVEGIETKFYGKDADAKMTIIKLVDRHKAIDKLAKYQQVFGENSGDTTKIKLTKDTETKLINIFEDTESRKDVLVGSKN